MVETGNSLCEQKWRGDRRASRGAFRAPDSFSREGELIMGKNRVITHSNEVIFAAAVSIKPEVSSKDPSLA